MFSRINLDVGIQQWELNLILHSTRYRQRVEEDSLNGIKYMFMEGHTTEVKSDEALRGHQLAVEETKSPHGEEVKMLGI